jgi:competence protein ComEC
MLKKLDKILIILLIVTLFIIGRGYFKDKNSSQVQGDIESANELKVYYLDVGQGDSTLIRTPGGQDILIDGGPDNTVIGKLGKYLPVNDWDIELMILSHPHSDHVTGLVEVLKRYQVDEIWMTGAIHTSGDYLELLNLIKENNIKVKFVSSSEIVELENNLEIEIFYPIESFFETKMESLNNTSIVFNLSYGATSFLFTGDFEQEEGLVDLFDFRTDVYQVGHHGSNNGNDREFLEAVDPDWAVISVGEDNRYGHPQYRTLKNFENLGVDVLRTDQNGDVIFVSNGSRIE